MKKDKEYCDHCGASIVKYKHSLNAGMIKGLILLDKAGGTSLFSDLNLTFNQKNNFQKLRYWSLIKSVSPGCWSITGLGLQFLLGEVYLPKRVQTFRGEYVEPTVEETDRSIMVNIFDVLEEHSYWYKNDYLKNRSAVRCEK